MRMASQFSVRSTTWLAAALVLLALGMGGKGANAESPNSANQTEPLVFVSPFILTDPQVRSADFETETRQVGYDYGNTQRQYAVVPVATQEEVQAVEEVVPLPLVENEFGELILDNTCAGCGGGGCGGGGCGGCGGYTGCGGCIGGCQSCGPNITAKTRVGRFMQGVYSGMCCPDPCYEPHWQPIADASFFAAAPRPMTQTRLRFDRGMGLTRPDLGEFFWARADGSGLGPPPPAGSLATARLNYSELKLYNEIAHGGFSAIMEFPYRSIDADGQPRMGGFSDMMFGTKSLMLDTELLQWSLIFRTYVPVGVPLRGLGTGHVSIEPALAVAMNFAPETYLQGEIAERVPIGGNSQYSGGVLQYHLSLNHTLFRPQPSMPIIGTFEVSGYTFHEGAYTDPVLGTRFADRTTYLGAGPGLRVFLCNRMDFGVGSAISLTDNNLADYLIRSEFRMRF
jgi:hypothetical protein